MVGEGSAPRGDRHDGASPSSRMIALLAGATGLVGREILHRLAGDERVAQVRALVRRPLPSSDTGPRILECRADFERLDANPQWFEVDTVFCALGTTIRQAGSEEAFRRVDHDYPLAIARAALAHGARHFLLVSALGADARSSVFYSRVKGELEEAVRALGYPCVTIARPSVLLGDRSDRRMGEEIARHIGWLAPVRFRPVQAARVAAALIEAAHAPVPGVRIIDNTALRSAVPA